MYEIARTHLNDDGIFGQWVPLYEMNPDDVRIFLATFRSSFPYTNLWIVGYDAILVGSMQPIVYDYGDIREHLTSNHEINSDFELMSNVLATSGTYSLFYQMLIPYRMSDIDVKEFSGGGLNTDDYPILEFSTARNTIYQQNVKKTFDAVNEFLNDKHNLILSPPFTNLTTRYDERITINFVDLEIGLDSSWKEVESKINVDHLRNVVYMEAIYSRDSTQLYIRGFPLPDQTLTKSIKENIMKSLGADTAIEKREVVINEYWGYEVKRVSNGRHEYAVSWFCEDNNIIYSIVLSDVTETKEQEIVDSLKCLH